ncbi:hypothetical protein MSAR_09670 [Mycolicibacterium sarraceniae]|uniref:Alpha/beta-hydrolase catalytic domain-containing protein n=1 Tax=Mycolicibacterium sarraceniae TaxID=1534348 RepID=A0A7I7SN22_9MYCO|nr:alpha/beta-hydrolase family protein [Mycolicibacterium sarraceniae]BBY57831.1 hypothetical protein MSAR_09670 [Mycolicibacterium sarraceniae]
MRRSPRPNRGVASIGASVLILVAMQYSYLPSWISFLADQEKSAEMAGDVTSAQASPIGHGHNYGDSQLDGWVAVAAPDGWTPADTERIRRALEKLSAAGGPEFQ